MSYQKTLASMISKSQKSLREIAKLCDEQGVNIDPSYISKLQSGKDQAPASEKVNIAIAKACAGDPDTLLFEAYMDKAPQIINEFVTKTVNLYREIIKSVLLSQLPKEQALIIENNLDSLSDRKFIQMIVNEGFDLPPQINENTFIAKDQDDKDVKILVGPLFSVSMPDDSMYPIIPKGASFQLETPDRLINGDIVIIKLQDNSFLVRRYVPIDNKIVLIAENKGYEAQTFDADTITIAAKVKSVFIDL
ncbi:MAG: S24 family peptidase [Bacillota bacterium]